MNNVIWITIIWFVVLAERNFVWGAVDTHIYSKSDANQAFGLFGSEAEPVSLLPQKEYHIVCPEGWYHYRESCYMFINATLTYEEADAACMRAGACLTSSASREENEFIATTVSKGQRSWIGGSDLCVEDDWRWVNGDQWGYTNWREGEPNQKGMRKEQCLEINYMRPGIWNNHFCSKQKSAVCKWTSS